MTQINDIADLVRILRENPDWTDILRGILLSKELLELPTKFPELIAAVAELTAGQAELRAAVAELTAGQAELRTTTQELTAAVAELTAGQAELRAAVAELTAGQAELRAAVAELTAGQAELRAAVAELTAGQAELRAAVAELTAGQAELRTTTQELTAAVAELTAGQAELRAVVAELTAGQAELRAVVAELTAGQAELRAVVAELTAGQAELRTTTQELVSTVRVINLRLDRLEGRFANIEGHDYERRVRYRVLNRATTVLGLEEPYLALSQNDPESPHLSGAISNALRERRISRDEAEDLHNTDIIISAPDNQHLAVEVSLSSDLDDYRRAHRRAALLRTVTRGDARPVVVIPERREPPVSDDVQEVATLVIPLP